MKLINWFAGFFEDQTGSASSKRIGLYWSMSLVSYMVIKGTSNMEMFWGAVGMALIFGGYATSEFFKKPLK